jgi:Protein of unknown function (DUF1203)
VIATAATYRIHAIDPVTADALRAAASVVKVADSEPGWPCRQCLRDARVGEELVLVSYDPFDASSTSPYRTPSPVFLHRQPCHPAAPTADPPVQLTSRRLSLRAFDADDMMLGGHVVDGQDLGKVLADLFADDATVQVHVHNAAPGCFAARVTRSV